MSTLVVALAAEHAVASAGGWFGKAGTSLRLLYPAPFIRRLC